MRRLVFVFLGVLFLVSCVTPSSEQSPRSNSPQEDGPGSVANETAQDSEDSPSESPAELPRLELVNPVDPGRITQGEILFAGFTGAGELTALEIELVGGVLVSSSEEAPFARFDAADLSVPERRIRVELEGVEAIVPVPPGMIDGERYALRVRGVLEDGRVTEWLTDDTQLDLRRALPELASIARTIDTTPEWTLDGDFYAQAVEFVLFSDGTRTAVVEARGTVATVSGELEPGVYQVSAQEVLPDGTVSRVGPWTELYVLDDAAPVPSWPLAESLGPRVGLHWRPIDRAVAYEIRYRQVGGTAWQEHETGPQVFAQVPDLLEPGTELEWQVRARNDQQRWYSWSGTSRFTVGAFTLDFAPVLPIGERVTYTRGYEEGSRDERPSREVTLTAPFEMMITRLTNIELARIIALGVLVGVFEVQAGGVCLVRDGRLAVGVGDLDHGRQYALLVEAGALQVVPVYEDHPAVGMMWIGSLTIADLLSYAEGRLPAMTTAGHPLPEADGYLLPTEAEWEYAARGSDERLTPWGGGLSGTASNYFRSGDPFEDPIEPYVANGGPTTPAGYYDGSVRGGFQTNSNASPFGILDLLGNVWEWTLDRYRPGFYSDGPSLDPVELDGVSANRGREQGAIGLVLTADQRVVRGTAWNSRADDVRLTNRGRFAADAVSYSIGLRLVRRPSP